MDFCFVLEEIYYVYFLKIFFLIFIVLDFKANFIFIFNNKEQFKGFGYIL